MIFQFDLYVSCFYIKRRRLSFLEGGRESLHATLSSKSILEDPLLNKFCLEKPSIEQEPASKRGFSFALFVKNTILLHSDKNDCVHLPYWKVL